MFRKGGILCVLLMYGFLHASAQNLDSLQNVLNKTKQDTNYVKTLREICYYYLFERSDIEKALNFNDKAIDAAKKIKSDFWCGKLFALKAYIKQNYTSDLQEAISYNFKSLEYYDKAGNESDKVAVYINLGSQYFDYGQMTDAEKYLKLGLEIAEKYNLSEDRALINSNLGSVYAELKNYEKSMLFLNEARDYYIKTEQELEIARMDFAVANNKLKKEVPKSQKLKMASEYLDLSAIFKKYDMIDFYIGASINAVVMYNQTGEFEKALTLLNEIKPLAESTKNYKILSNLYSTFASNAKNRGDFENEAMYLKKVMTANDSLFNETKDKVLSEVQIKYQTEKIESQNELLQKNSEIKDLELSKKDIEIAQSNTVKFALLGGLTLIVVFTFFLYNRFKITNRQKKTIEHQKILVEEKQKEITDSIKYAQRLQEAILPAREVIKHYLPESFLLYKPKDIVAGDFYFFEVINDTIYIAAADCTGHGVPGAMVSVVCSNALHRSIKEFNLSDPGRILDNTRDLVVQTFEKSGQEVRDGMDIALCVIKNNKIAFAGANNPCWILRDEEFIVLPADKQPIGKFDITDPYTTQKWELKKGDQIYIFTDGYNDQFGGKDGKKFKAKNFANLIKTIRLHSMEGQKIEIEKAFEKWRGNLDQIDDVCVMGIRI
jgi:serine phosphatase RsbU (regulator of sigma subunit)